MSGTLSTVNGASVYSSAVKVQEALGRLSLTPAAGADGLHYNGLVSIHSHDFAGRLFGVQIVQIPDSQSNAELLISVGRDGANLYRFY